MIEFLLSISTWLGIIISMVLATVAGFLVYGISAQHPDKRPMAHLFQLVQG